MAEALALTHWEARIDAADVEFVLGGAPCLTHRPVPSLRYLRDMKADSSTDAPMSRPDAGVRHVWLLHFNQCQAMTMDDQGIDQAVKRFFDNEPYYPRPFAVGSEDLTLWEVFESRYLEDVDSIVDPKERTLPRLFVEKVKERARVKAEAANE